MGRLDYSRFIGRLPYASEMFGLYRPMIGWDSKRKRDRLILAHQAGLWPWLATASAADYLPRISLEYGDPGHVTVNRVDPGERLQTRRVERHQLGAAVLDAMALWTEEKLGPGRRPQGADEWKQLVNESTLADKLHDPVLRQWHVDLEAQREAIRDRPALHGEEAAEHSRRMLAELRELVLTFEKNLEFESQVAGLLIELADNGATAILDRLFFGPPLPFGPQNLIASVKALQTAVEDPFALLDPSLGLPGVAVSPIGIVHLYRQYFFEFDNFLGPAVGHVWLTPGATVELIESSTRKILTERMVETEQELRLQSEKTSKEQDEFSTAIKTDNRSDTKLGFSTTVTQGWGVGNAVASASLNLDTTQQLAREETHKRMREQSEKVSTELRSLYKTTFKTVTESTDVSSKRYVLSNPGGTLLNYEMRRKMRQVGVQTQDVGTYLCWETFVDEPGVELGLADLVHIAKPPDLVPQPNQSEVGEPPRLTRSFQVTTTFSFPERRRTPFDPPGYIALEKQPLAIAAEEGYELEEKAGTKLELAIRSVTGEDSTNQRWPFVAVIVDANTVQLGVIGTANGTIYWPHSITFVLEGTVHLVATSQKMADIAAANKKILADAAAATRQQQRTSEAAYYTAAKERIEQASGITARKFEDLREEERTVVYRRLIRDLMAKDKTTPIATDDHYDTASNELRHLYATVLNAIFDIDKMLYFVSPEWWKPRERYGQYAGKSPGIRTIGKNARPAAPFSRDDIANWSDGQRRLDNYYITAKSEPAPLGASLGWLLQLDGDDNRNRFLNAPWVRAVIPIRPGKEQAAINWLQKAEVEGTDGLEAAYGETGEYVEITAGLGAAGLTASNPPTIGDALRYLCLRVSQKHAQSSQIKLFPDRGEIPEPDKVWAVPIDRVYEHGFYPLERSFHLNPAEETSNSEGSRNFQIIAQWTEVLPTDQVVPVAVEYDPITGRQKTL